AEARTVGMSLAELLGLRPFELDDSARTLYHAGAVFASNYLVTLQRAASLLFEAAGAPPAALEPLMRRTIENGFELTGPPPRVDVLFAPSVDEMYGPGFGTWIDVEGAGAEGEARPAHFRAVATVCLKLFNIVRPARAYFGQKDARQAAVVRRLVRDLNLELEIRVRPTVR